MPTYNHKNTPISSSALCFLASFSFIDNHSLGHSCSLIQCKDVCFTNAAYSYVEHACLTLIDCTDCHNLCLTMFATLILSPTLDFYTDEMSVTFGHIPQT